MFRYMKQIPGPGQIDVKLRDNMRVMILSQQINSLTRRVHHALKDFKVCRSLLETSDPNTMITGVQEFQPDVIVCPFMKVRIPAELYSIPGRPCLIVHPGIAGDCGASSLDWAIHNGRRTWGVTVLQASPVFDQGDIWSTENFPVPENCTKSSLYNGGVSDSAIRCVLDSLSRFSNDIPPTPLSDAEVSGCFIRNMKHSDRRVDWSSISDDICTTIRMSDTQPGALGWLEAPGFNNECRMFDAHVETGKSCQQVDSLLKEASPGQVVAQRNKALLFKAGDGNGVWVGQMKKKSKHSAVKVPSVDFVTNILNSRLSIPTIYGPCSHDDIQVERRGHVVYVYFDFYNGAMDRQQGNRLAHTLSIVNKMEDVKVVALMGGDRFFSTGINLCVIESSPNKQVEAWANINAINDVIETFKNMTDKTTVAVVRSNAGAGGVMLAAACDVTISHKGALFTPSYKSMNLYGSEYWTYFLPRRVGHKMAQTMTNNTDQISTDEAKSSGLIDHILNSDKHDLMGEVSEFLVQLIKDGVHDDIVRGKRIERDAYWRQLLHAHRNYELSIMKENFRSTEFIKAMSHFVHH